MNDLPAVSRAVRPLPFEPSFEQIPDDEAQTSEELAKALHSIMETTFKDNGHATRSVHAKAHGLLRGRITEMSARFRGEHNGCPIHEPR
ncbi:hypothetical protein SAMN04488483_0883 [Pseudomonas helmanticensis]|uniref:Uncharacterized protein n=1 Tax=Pseudomonas helmanticensis TaxID=1471381 RepID=A0ACD2U1S2_9PSED|nr:hypothetical protein SAMN04488483_0883 [Pseudomonas helmanticensis]